MRNINIVALIFLCVAFVGSGFIYYVTRPKRADYLVYELHYPSMNMFSYLPDQSKGLIQSNHIETVNLLDGYHSNDTVRVTYKRGGSIFDISYSIYLIIQKPHRKENYLDTDSEAKF